MIYLNVPELRFPEFSGEWEETPLKQLLSFKNGLNASKEKYGKGTKFINVSDILNNDFLTYENIEGSVEVSKEQFDNYLVSYGDVLFQRSSETREEVGTSNVYLDSEKKCVFGGFVIRGAKISNYDPFFLKELLKISSTRKEITSRSGGSTRYNIGQESLRKININLPSFPEQEKIASFLSKVDEKIEKLEKKQELWQTYKKGMIQKIFSQELRFKDENGEDYPDWEKIALNKILIERKEYHQKNDYYTHVTLSKNGISIKDKSYNRDFLVKTENKQYKITKFNDICYNPANLKFGVICINKYGSAIFSPIYVTFEVNKWFNDDFISRYLIRKEFINKIRKYEEGTVYERMAVKPSDFLKAQICVPSLKEQTKIADFLVVLDNEISKIKKTVEINKGFKKGLLQKMFC